MKRLLIILFCLPLIGLGQITITEVTTAQKKQNNINLSHSFKSGLGIDIFPMSFGLDDKHNLVFFSYYLIPNVNYNISINNKFSIYNNVALPIMLRFPKTIEHTSYAYDNAGLMIGLIEYQYSYSATLITKLEYNVGVQAEMIEGLQSRLGMIIPIIGYSIIQGGSKRQWGGGFNLEFNYSLTDNLCPSLSISQEWISSPFANSLKNSGSLGTVTEILIGVNYKL